MSQTITLVSIVVLFASEVVWAGEPPLSGQPVFTNVFGLQRPADAIDAGASIAILRIEAINERPNAERIVRGTATLSVVDILHGELPDQVSVAYAYPRGFEGLRASQLIWRDSKPGNGDLLLCFVVPEAYDPSAERKPVPREGDPPHFAVSRVISLRGMDDPRIKPYRIIAQLAAVAGTPDEISLLDRAATDPDINVRFYIVDVIVNRIATIDPSFAKRILYRVLKVEQSN